MFGRISPSRGPQHLTQRSSGAPQSQLQQQQSCFTSPPQLHYDQFIQIVGSQAEPHYPAFCQFISHPRIAQLRLDMRTQIQYHMAFCNFISTNPSYNRPDIDAVAVYLQSLQQQSFHPHPGNMHPNSVPQHLRMRIGHLHGPRHNTQEMADYPSNATIITAFLEGKKCTNDVLKVTMTCIKTCTERGLPISVAIGLVRAMNEAGVASDIVIHSAMITTLGNAGIIEDQTVNGQTVRGAKSVYHETLGLGIANVVTHNAMITVLGNAGIIEDQTVNGQTVRGAKSVYHETLRLGIANVVTHSAMITALSNAGKWQEANTIYIYMQNRATVNGYTYPAPDEITDKIIYVIRRINNINDNNLPTLQPEFVAHVNSQLSQLDEIGKPTRIILNFKALALRTHDHYNSGTSYRYKVSVEFRHNPYGQ